MAKYVMRQAFGEDELVLEFGEVHYVGFKKQKLFTLTYLTPGGESVNGKHIMYSNNSETYLESERELAFKAFDARAAQKYPFKCSPFDRPLKEFMEKEPT